MSGEKALGKVFGQELAVVLNIINRIRTFAEKGGGYDRSFLEWFAKAPDSVLDQMFGNLINAWQADMAKKAIEERERVDVLVQCDGDPSYHKCEDRGCLHRLPHTEKGGCTQKIFNGSHGWCRAPGSQLIMSPGEEDGSLVTCLPVQRGVHVYRPHRPDGVKH